MLIDLLKKNQKSLVDKWFNTVIDSYPAESARFLKNNTDQFANPIGHTTISCLKDTLQALIDNGPPETFIKLMDPIIRIRAVQDFTPEQAVGFLFWLKSILRHEFGAMILSGELTEEYLEFESRIDKAACTGFNIYMECRNQIASLEVKRSKNQVRNALREKGLLKNEGEDS